MKAKEKRYLLTGLIMLAAFAIFTCLVLKVDVKPLGVNNTPIGFSSFNCYFHRLCGVNMTLYTITDWAGLVPVMVVLAFALLGLVQLIKRKSLLKVDADILALGVYYIIVVMLYIVFEMVPVNYRPILINGFMEASYPSSTTLLVLSVMPTLTLQISLRCKKAKITTTVQALTALFSLFMVLGRLISGVHWFTDIFASVIISVGLICIYKGFTLITGKKV